MTIKTKYKVGDRVWILCHVRIKAFIIREIVVHVIGVDDTGKTITSVEYKSTGTMWAKEAECFPTQAALLKQMKTKEQYEE